MTALPESRSTDILARLHQPLISVIVPLFNEEENVPLLYEALISTLSSAAFRFELIFVDDGSSDGTAQVAGRLAMADERLVLLQLRRNCGQTPAMSAGIDFARGEILVTLDGDLQNDPRDIAKLVQAVEEGADLAVGWREARKDHKWSRVIPSKIANRLIASVTGIPIRDNGCSLKAYRASVIKRIPLYSEMHRFIPAMASIAGARVVQIPVRHHARRFGESKYGIGRAWRVLIDLLSIKTIVVFSSRPLLWFSALAFIPGVVAALTGSFALLDFLANERRGQYDSGWNRITTLCFDSFFTQLRGHRRVCISYLRSSRAPLRQSYRTKPDDPPAGREGQQRH